MSLLKDLLDAHERLLHSLLVHAVPTLLWIVAIGLTAGFLYGVYEGVSFRLRANEIARCFLQLLEVGLKQGRSLEQTTVSLSEDRVRTLGVYLHLMAGYIERGLRFDQALDAAPRFLPPHIREMLKAGAEIGNTEKVLSLCRSALSGGTSSARSSINNAVIVACLFPIGTFAVWTLSIYVLPKFRDITMDFVGSIPPLPQTLSNWSTGLMVGLFFVWLLFTQSWAFSNAPIFKPLETRVRNFLGRVLPWRRKRIQRNFSAMLALALDAGIPEAKAIALAARSTANEHFVSRAEKTVTALGEGLPLSKAVEELEDTGEFAWRIRNVRHSAAPFMSALAGWHDALELRACHQEEAASQFVTSAVVLVNGCAVGLLSASIFLFLIAIIEEIILW